MQGMLLAAAISPDNTPHGYNLTFAFPMLMFIVIAALLYFRFRSPRRVPGQVSLTRFVAGSEGVPGDTTPGSTLQEGQARESEDGE